MAYSQEQIESFRESYGEWQRRADDLSTRLLTRVYLHERSRTLAAHGLIRRLRTLERCMDNVYDLIDPAEDNPSRDNITDASIFLQAFIFNVFGVVDNFARLWAWEKGVLNKKGNPLSNGQIGLMPGYDFIRDSLSPPFQEYLNASAGWFEYLENYRHALAHRIPLYIPPKRFNDDAAKEYRRLELEQNEALKARDFDRFDELFAEQGNLGFFEPWMMHSYGPENEDAKSVMFHGQLICDLATVVEIGEKLADELDALPLVG
jgi:hypothetical protein